MVVVREELLAAAIAAVRDTGPSVSMNDIAARAGVSKPSLYRQFGSKRGLYSAIADWFVEDLLLGIATYMREDLTLQGFLHDVVAYTMQRVHDDVLVYEFLMRRARMELASPGETDRGDFMRKVGDRLGEVVEQWLALKGFDPRPAYIWSHGVVGMVHAVADWSLDHPDLGLDTISDEISGILWHGFQEYDGPMLVS